MNRLRLYFINGRPCTAGIGIVSDVPQLYGRGDDAKLYESAPSAACGCRGGWTLEVFEYGIEVHLGWRESYRHSQACRRSEV